MNNTQLIQQLQQSQWWNNEYNNFDARSDEAKQFITQLGYKIPDYSEVPNYLWTNDKKATGDIILVGFKCNEPDYGSYGSDWEAKEATPSYTPDLTYLVSIEDYNIEVSKIKNKKLEKQKKAATERISWLKSKIIEYQTIIDNNNLDTIEKIEGRKYKYQFFGEKFATIEEANNYRDNWLLTSNRNWVERIAEASREIEQLTTLINNDIY